MVSSKGWGRLVGHYRKYFHEEFEVRVSALIKNGGDSDHIKQLVACREMSNEIFRHPNLRIEQIKAAEESRVPAVGGSRRGPL